MTWSADTMDGLRAWVEDETTPRAVGVIDETGTSCAVGPTVDRGATFAIGSVTKTMVATVLASLHLDDGLDLDTTLGQLLDVPANGDITLRQLVTHTSGLPRLAPNFTDHEHFDHSDPYARYTVEHALDGLASVDRKTSEDHPEEYSNYGFQLLGVALEAAADRPLATLLHQRIFDPLGMSGAAHRCGAPTRRAVPGVNRGKPIPRWNLLLGGPGGVECTIDELALWAQAVLTPGPDPVGRAIALASDETAPLAWALGADGKKLWHNGGEAGGSSMVIVDRPGTRAAVGLAAAHPDAIETAIVAAFRDGEIPSPPSHPAADDDDPCWAVAGRCLGAIRSGDVETIVAALTPAYRDSPSVADIPDELAEMGPIADGEPVRLPGFPLSISASLRDRPDRRLQIVLDDEGEHMAGFITYPADSAPPW